jgi:general secretion pathway protein H
MPMLAVGNDATGLRCKGSGAASFARGFTLIELMVVITLIAIATAGVSFALRDNESTLLDREADRLATILETTRVQSRSTGVALAWLPLAQGFVIVPASVLKGASVQMNAASISPWLAPGISAQIAGGAGGVGVANPSPRSLLLGAEPMIAPASVLLSLGARRLSVSTDGLRPFAVTPLTELAAKP